MRKKTLNCLSNMLCVFMMLQPFFDIFYFYEEDKQIFGFALPTIIRIIVIIAMLILSYLYIKDKSKNEYIIYISMILIVYFICHNYVSSNFYYFKNQFYSVKSEIFYIIRMLMPFSIMLFTFLTKMTKKEFDKIILVTSYTFSIIMIVTNILKIAYASYGGGDYLISDNIFSWFVDGYDKYNYMELASKGIFHMANQVSATLLLILPYLYYMFFKTKKAKYYLALLLQSIAMLMLGTRIASYGLILVELMMFALYIFYVIIKKISFDKVVTFLIIMLSVFNILLLSASPVNNRYYSSDLEESIDESVANKGTDEELKRLNDALDEYDSDNVPDELKNEIIAFIKDNYITYDLDSEYVLKLYPYTEHYQFWIRNMELPYSYRANHRTLETLITHDYYDKGQSLNVSLFGISFSGIRAANSYIERDIFVHYFSIGIFGIALFIAPYFAVLGYCVYMMFKYYKDKMTFLNVTVAISIAITFIAGILSGNVFDELIVTLYLGMYCGFLYINVIKKGAGNNAKK